MPLIGVFLATFAIVFLLQRRKGAPLLDQLHRGTLAAIGATLLALAIAIFAGG